MTGLSVPHTLATSPRRSFVRVTWLGLGLTGILMTVWVVSLSRSIFDPLGDDQALYQYITDRVIAGERMYIDVWDQNLPGIVGIHWVSTHLLGRSPMAFRTFDALWQMLTLLAIGAVGWRASGRKTAGLVPPLLYAVTYYGYGYMQTGQREGFAVLPLLLASLIVTSGADRGSPCRPTALLLHIAAGVLAFFAFFIKSPLGLCYGVLWCWSLKRSWERRREGVACIADLACLTAGFVLAAGGAVAWLWQSGMWDEFWRVFTRADMRGYVGGPALIGGVVPEVLLGVVLIGIAGGVGLVWAGGTGRERINALGWCMPSLIACVLLLITYRWELWRNYVVLPSMGILLPAAGAILAARWSERCRTWKVVALMAAGSWGAFIIQGRFSPYQAMPFLAFAAVLAAIELVERVPEWLTGSGAQRAWVSVCIAAIVQTAVCHWWWTMTTFTTEPYVLASKSLDEHYDRVTKHKLKYPRYATTAKVARRVRELTSERDPIISLFHDPRTYYYCQRPAVSRFFIALPEFQHRFGETAARIRDRKPKVVLTRISTQLAEKADWAAQESAAWAAIEAFCGSSTRLFRDDYRLSDVIDGVCILQPSCP